MQMCQSAQRLIFPSAREYSALEEECSSPDGTHESGCGGWLARAGSQASVPVRDAEVNKLGLVSNLPHGIKKKKNHLILVTMHVSG